MESDIKDTSRAYLAWWKSINMTEGDEVPKAVYLNADMMHCENWSQVKTILKYNGGIKVIVKVTGSLINSPFYVCHPSFHSMFIFCNYNQQNM